MKLLKLEDIKGTEILARAIMTNNYKELLSEGTCLKKEYISKLKELGITQVYVKEIYINNKIYDLSDFKGIANRSSQKALFLFIPTKDVERVNSMKVKFFLVEEDENTKEKSFYITNEYIRAY